tara:strand:- start:609 stop:794 length:186 start_codon:yes stop_codon:yes gene_type:complete
MTPTKSKEWLMQNAVLAYLHHYPNNTWTQQYKDLLEELKGSPVRKQGRPAKRRKPTKETAS